MGGGGGGDANFAGSYPFPGQDQVTDINNYVTESIGYVTFPTTGTWTFDINSDDGARLEVDGLPTGYAGFTNGYNLNAGASGTIFGLNGGVNNVFDYNAPASPHDFGAQLVNLPAGTYKFDLIFYEDGGGAEVEMSAAPHAHGIHQ